MLLSPSPALAQGPETPPTEVAPTQTPADQAEKSHKDFAARVLHLALHHSVWGEPAVCQVRQAMRLNEHRITGFGQFARAGRGSGKLNLSLQYPASDSMNSLLQISDGQRLHTLEEIQGERRRTIIDLDKVRRRLVINNNSIADPKIALYLAIGGQAESLRRLCQQYEWFHVANARYGDVDVWEITGRLSEAPPFIQADTTSDHALTKVDHSGLLPTRVILSVGKDGDGTPLPFWLYQARHYRKSSEKSPLNHGFDLLLVTEWIKPTLVAEGFEPATFEASSTSDPLFEETERYLPQTQQVATRPAVSGRTAVSR